MLFSELVRFLQNLEETASRNAITQTLAELFRQSHPGEIGKLCYLLQGRVVPLYEAVEFGLADKFIIRAIAQADGVDGARVVSEFKRQGDLGKAAQALHVARDTKLSVSDVYEALLEIAKAGGPGSQERKIGILADILTKVDAASACYVVRIPLNKLRLGFSEMTILDSLSWMIAGDKSLRQALEDAFNVRPDIGFIAETVKREGIRGLSRVKARVGSPVLAQLCQRLPTADEMIKKMGKVAVEPKYDGVRVQIHYKKSSAVSRQLSEIKHLIAEDRKPNAEIKTFSRNLENTTAMFPELEDVGKQLNAQEVILDGEAVGVDPKTGKLVSFQETTTRKRKHHIREAQESVPLRFYVFDILYKNGKDLLGVPLLERRKTLEETVQPGKLLVVSPQIVVSTAEEIRAYHDAQIKAGLEGAVVKKWNSPYEPGRRGYSWVKFKEEEGKTGKLEDTIDAVVMGYYAGEGKRAGFGIGAFLVGVRKGDGFVTITKIGTGVSDELWKELKNVFSHQSSVIRPKEYEHVDKTLVPDKWVEPSIVVEIAGDDLTKSPTHGAGYAVRFPRLVRIRTDKKPQDATTVSEISQMFLMQRNRKQ